MRPTPLRVSLAAIVIGALIVVGGLALGGAPTYSSGVPAEQPDLEIIPEPGDEPDPVRGSPGSREQVALFGGMIIALGVLGAFGSASARAARQARERATGQSPAIPAQ